MSETADEAFAQFVRARGASLMRYGFLLSGNEADAADLLQDALIGLRGKWSRIRRQEAVEAYVRRSMARQYIRIWRRRRREHLVGTPPDLTAPADQVWPQAVITVPARFGAGANEPITMLDEHRMLLAVRVSADKVVSLAVYDTRTGTERLLTDLPDPPGVRGYWPGAFTAAGGMVVWTAYVFGNDRSQTSEYWTMRDDGTDKRRFTTGDVGERRVAVDGTLYGSGMDRGGISRMPLAGGTPAKIAGSEGFEITRWPWAVTAAPAGTDRPEAWNLLTGERRTPKPRPQPTRWWTAADQDVWLGLDANGRTFAQATDGSWELTTNGFEARSITGGRFDRGTVKNWLHPNDPRPPAIWDLRTGLVGTFTGDSFRQQVSRPLLWSPAGDSLKVVDVSRI